VKVATEYPISQMTSGDGLQLVPASSAGGSGIGCGQPASRREVLDGIELFGRGLNVLRSAAVLAEIPTLQLKRKRNQCARCDSPA